MTISSSPIIKIRAAFEPLRFLDAASIDGDYVAIGTPFLNPSRLISIDNDTDVSIIISTDGVTPHAFIKSSGFKLFDLNANRSEKGDGYGFPIGTTIYVKSQSGAAPMAGTGVYVTMLYAQ